jgi:hypothetical protein
MSPLVLLLLLRMLLRRWDDGNWGCKKALAMHAETAKGRRTRMVVGAVFVCRGGVGGRGTNGKGKHKQQRDCHHARKMIICENPHCANALKLCGDQALRPHSLKLEQITSVYPVHAPLASNARVFMVCAVGGPSRARPGEGSPSVQKTNPAPETTKHL